ncbi:MAG: hypothetical protein NUV74_05295 [Candidatus Brocadiaceae bacterium]|nr:hypothetical protein [Candidatus Brocadiaceae bacterium]
MNQPQNPNNPADGQSRAGEAGANLSGGLAAMSLEEVTERVLAMEGAVQRIMVIVAMALPHTDAALSAMNAEWGRIISDIERDHSKAANVISTP